MPLTSQRKLYMQHYLKDGPSEIGPAVLFSFWGFIANLKPRLNLLK